MADASGIKTAVESLQAGVQSVSGNAAAEQLALLPDESEAENGAEKGSPAARGAGRPAGSANKSTKEWQQHILSQFSSPLIGLARIATMPLHEVAKLLGVKHPEHMAFDKALDILKVQVGCMNALAPYVHQKMPTAIDAGENGLIQLVINSGTPAQRTEEAAPIDIQFIKIEDEQNQEVSHG
ncbi:MAG: hypothetical protein DI551_00700 [Micavibrio aeruginosavorus]|uniref:Uncharacterized protein n=1 Tax=Micavibrio aeruginosavorus TaxID=349221 RepID=A0A2W5N5Y0_9BACT|nr:MAG: hypothetical protein DI551_00700 [Micavibrio aeruginosavorus]